MKIRFCFALFMVVVFAPGISLARWLKVDTGRFMTMDTYEGDTRDPLSLHKYNYAEADPVDGFDPSGHDDLDSMLMPVFSIIIPHIKGALTEYKFNVVRGSHHMSYVFGGEAVWGQPGWAATGSYTSTPGSDYADSTVTIRTRTNPWGHGAGNSCNSIDNPDPAGTIQLYLRNSFSGDYQVWIYGQIKLTGTGPQGAAAGKLEGGGEMMIDGFGTTAKPFGEADVCPVRVHVGTQWTLAAKYIPTISIGPDQGVTSTATAYGKIEFISATAK